MLDDARFGTAGRTIVIEAFLTGEEISVMALTDGRDVELLPVAQDHKRLQEGDRGPNTGGMGAYSPVALATSEMLDRVKREVFHPTLEEMQRRRIPFSGVLYAGLMIDAAGIPSVVEFNCRLGDPEAEAILPLVAGGLTDALWKISHGEAPSVLETAMDAAVTTVLASRGYPEKPELGSPIALPQRLPRGVTIFHAGTARDADGTLRVNGGRVMTVTGVAPTFREAQQLSRQTAEAVQFEGKIFRSDIGWREASRHEERFERVL
jgi:phosphoribosylamine--glycine ligase